MLQRNEKQERLANTTLVLATILLLSHLLSIQPSDLEAMGIRVHIDDPALIRGSIAILLVHYILRTYTAPWTVPDHRTLFPRSTRHLAKVALYRTRGMVHPWRAFWTNRLTKVYRRKAKAKRYMFYREAMYYAHQYLIYIITLAASILAIWDFLGFLAAIARLRIGH